MCDVSKCISAIQSFCDKQNRASPASPASVENIIFISEIAVVTRLLANSKLCEAGEPVKEYLLHV